MRKRIINAEDFPLVEKTRGQESITQDKIYEYIKKHPNCTRKDLYSLDPNEGHIRRSITTMLKSNKLKETFKIR